MISNFGWFETQKPPTVPTDLENVPITKSTSIQHALILGHAATRWAR